MIALNFLQTTFVGTLRDVTSFLTFFNLRPSRCVFIVFPDVRDNSQRTQFDPRGDAMTGTLNFISIFEKGKTVSRCAILFTKDSSISVGRNVSKHITDLFWISRKKPIEFLFRTLWLVSNSFHRFCFTSQFHSVSESPHLTTGAAGL